MRVQLAVPEGQMYSCRRCGWCCRGWRILVEPDDRDRLLARDWAQDSPRLRGVPLFEEQRLPGQLQPSIQIAKLKGRCVFLEEDNLCLIHKVLGEQAKPFTCRRFPFLLGHTTEGVLVGADYACPALVRSEGEPFSVDKALVQEWLDGSPDRNGLNRRRNVDPEALLAPGRRMGWSAYLELERSLLEILARREFPVVARWAAGGALLVAMADWASGKRWLEQGEVAAWLREWRRAAYLPAFDRVGSAENPSLPELPVLAPMIGDIETPHTPTSGRGSAAIGYALAVGNGSGPLYLSTLEGWVELGALGRVDRDLSRTQFDDYLTRFLSNYLLRKSLLESPHLREGWDYLGKCLALAGWYGAASAAMHGRDRMEEDDLVAGIQAVEKAYVP